MKNIYLLPFILLMSSAVYSQNYPPVLIDSLYSWSWVVGLHNDTIITESWTGHSYDLNDSLIQRRRPNSRVDLSYSLDTTFLVAETLDGNGSWNLSSRTTTVLDGGVASFKLTENYQNNNWVNSASHIYLYNAAGLDSLYLLKHWKDGVWVNFYMKEKLFDAAGNNIEESEYYANEVGDFVFNRGKLFEYDNNNNCTQEITVSTSASGNYFKRRVNWVYTNDGLIDSVMSCDFRYPNDGVCDNTYMLTYDYSEPESMVENRFTWKSDDWEYSGQEITFDGPGIYSSRPDSAILYYYSPSTLVNVPTRRKYFEYEDLGNDEIYFKQEEFHYFENSSEWILTRVLEEWYHVKVLDDDELNEPNNDTVVYPNPSTVGQELSIGAKFKGKGDLEIIVYDMQGRLVSTEMLAGQTTFQAPNVKGVYSILILDKDQLIGIVKQVIVE